MTKKVKDRHSKYFKLKLNKRKKPTTVTVFAELLFEKDFFKQQFFLFLLRKAKAGFNSEDWAINVLEFLEYYSEFDRSINTKLVKDIKQKYTNWREQYSATKANRLLFKEIKQTELSKQFYSVMKHYHRLLKKMNNAGMIYKKDEQYKLSKEFREFLVALIDAWDNFVLYDEE
ncbi:hypothetical protein E3E31_12010 [Thermococcus sp. M39]|uniref:hypothetical protein n=2 Tax=unclassified Thermococcus TaxID=2627626 RepID=UPI00143C6903|nr:hypothetical protein [Thermococcus sp. M39]NJE09232.1 hypothetical protein [Thermococcus sp. M39]